MRVKIESYSSVFSGIEELISFMIFSLCKTITIVGDGVLDIKGGIPQDLEKLADHSISLTEVLE